MKNIGAAVALLLLGGSAVMASAQYGPGHRYEQRNESPASRWGYQDGFNDGSHDRATGHSFLPTHDSNYKHAPEYEHLPIPRDEYKNIYREAYVHGYERGYGR
jgi:hypothetical protein